MKPIKLLISAFGPYAELMPEINFEQFEDKGLFLITGDTGAGKTTIFDAICFALYGTTSGIYRDTKNLRSEYADTKVESFVDFYFSHQGHTYHIYRQPAYERRKQRGEGSITQKEIAILYDETGASIEGVNPVNQAVKELLHIDEKQFKQIAMIAQGEFYQLLNAKTDQRTEILRTIFMTNSYKNIEYKLKDLMDSNYAKKINAEHSILQYFADVSANEEDELSSRLIDLQKKATGSQSAWNLQEFLDILDEIIVSDQKEHQIIQTKLEHAETEYNANKEALAIAETNNRILDSLENLKDKQKSLTEQKDQFQEKQQLLVKQKTATHDIYPAYRNWHNKHAEIDKTLAEIAQKEREKILAKQKVEETAARYCFAQDNGLQIDPLKALITKITEEEASYHNREKLKKEILTLKESVSVQHNEEEKLKKEEAFLKEQILELKQTIAGLKNKPEEAVKLQAKEAELNRLLYAIKDILDNHLPERTKRQKTLRQEQERFQSAFAVYEKASLARMEAEKLLDSCRAGILALSLSEGEKCPVCGATHHPQPAHLPTHSITENDFEKLKSNESEKQTAKEKANTSAEKAKTALNEYEDNMRISILNCLEHPVLDAKPEGCSLDELIDQLYFAKEVVLEKIIDNTRLLNQVKEAVRSYHNAEADLEKAVHMQTHTLEQKKEKLRADIKSTETKLTEYLTTLEMLSTLSFENWTEAKIEKQKAEIKKAQLEKELEESFKNKNLAEKHLASVDAALNTLHSSLQTQRDDEIDFKKVLMDKITSGGFASTEIMLQYVCTPDSLADTEEQINIYNQKVVTNNAQLTQAYVDAEGKKYVDINGLRMICAEQNVVIQSLRNDENKVSNRITMNTKRKNNILEQRNTYETSNKEYGICKRLYDLVKGTTGNGKITLEQYIQAAGFDSIISAANRRLQPMSDGQYELYRQKDTIGKKSNNFLDLEVLDNYTGHRRPVGNLSGGESFKASLSLALGLSDTVASNLGGVQMDALFIDEGFGTLDKKSIENAMDILINLSGKNKLVGVISHREELIDNIPQQIRVKKTKDGSKIDIDAGL